MHSNLLLPTTATASVRSLRAIGAIGSILALTILGASVVLRLTTIFGTDGDALSQLSSEVENVIRMVHRLSASSVGILALAATVLGWKNRTLAPHLVKPIAWIVAATDGDWSTTYRWVECWRSDLFAIQMQRRTMRQRRMALPNRRSMFRSRP